ncbi:hypothetical protein HKBW3S47_02145, partial [Candidatus Hakubella thermalkaliphila]
LPMILSNTIYGGTRQEEISPMRSHTPDDKERKQSQISKREHPADPQGPQARS